MEYHRTKYILYAMQMLRYRNVKNTSIYAQLVGGKTTSTSSGGKTVERQLS
jgi:hypothetical protein